MTDMYRNLHVIKTESFSNGSSDAKTSTFYYCLEMFFYIYMVLKHIFPRGLHLEITLKTSKLSMSNASYCAVP